MDCDLFALFRFLFFCFYFSVERHLCVHSYKIPFVAFTYASVYIWVCAPGDPRGGYEAGARGEGGSQPAGGGVRGGGRSAEGRKGSTEGVWLETAYAVLNTPLGGLFPL